MIPREKVQVDILLQELVHIVLPSVGMKEVVVDGDHVRVSFRETLREMTGKNPTGHREY